MAIPIRDNTTALESLKTKAQNLPDRESGSSSGSGGVDTSDATAQSADVLYGKTYYGSNGKSTGTMNDNSGWIQNITVNGTYGLPDGYHQGSEVRVNVPTSSSGGTDTSDATAVSADVRDGVTFYNANGKQTGSMPDAVIRGGGISVNDDLLTADVTVDIANSGYIEAGNKVTHKMNVYSNDSVTPSSSDKTLATAGKYTMSNIIVKGDSNLVAENIKSGVSIFGVAGSYEGSLKYDATVKYDSVVDTLLFSNIKATGYSKYIKCAPMPNDTQLENSLQNSEAWVESMFVASNEVSSDSIYVMGRYRYGGELHNFAFQSVATSLDNGIKGDVNQNFENANSSTQTWDESYYGQIDFWHSYTDSEGNPSSINLTLPLRFLGTYGIKNLNFNS